MKYLVLLLFITLIQHSSFAQEISDSKAEEILKSMKQKFDGYENVATDFSLTIQFPDEEADIKKGKLWVSGDKYHLSLEETSIICDGIIIWYYLKNRNEVQINDYEENEGEDIMSPKDIFKIYDQDKFYYALTHEGLEDGKSIQQIEFKPKDVDSEYSKMRMTINKKDQSLLRMKVFGKDGSRYTLSIDNFSPNSDLKTGVFSFNPSDYPNIQIEDLRI